MLLLVLSGFAGTATADDPRASSEVEGNSLRLVSCEREFRALLKADHVVLYFWPPCLVPAHRSLATIRGWVREAQPRFPVYYVDCCSDKTTYARCWLEKEGLRAFAWVESGSVLCLRRGKVVSVLLVTDRTSNAVIQRWTDEAFRSGR
jgi:hypothetical protein